MSDEGSSPKESGCIVLASLPISEIVSATSIALTTSAVLHYLASQHQYRIVANYRIVSLKYGRLKLLNTSKMFQVKEGVS